MAEWGKNIFVNSSRKYIKDYTISVSGEAVYTGPLYEFNGDPAENRAHFVRFLILSSVMTALALLCGLIRVDAMNLSPVVTLAYGLGLIACFLLLASCIRLVRSKQPMERRTFDTSFSRMRWLPAAAAVCAATAFVATMVFEFSRRFSGFALPEAVFLAAQAAVTVMAVIIFLSSQSIQYHVLDQGPAD